MPLSKNGFTLIFLLKVQNQALKIGVSTYREVDKEIVDRWSESAWLNYDPPTYVTSILTFDKGVLYIKNFYFDGGGVKMQSHKKREL